MTPTTRIDLFKEEMKFSAAHFTIFSAGVRENLHGHNFTVRVEIDAAIGPEGLAFDYREAKRSLATICRGFNEILLLPTRNPHLIVEDGDNEVVARFGDERMVFLKRDVCLLPLRNISLEELSLHILNIVVPTLTADSEFGVRCVATRVSSGPGQSASSQWTVQ
ncbi:6-carboxytetrahydropterin synthase [Mycobacterium sp. 236(2023)]|uniref:6-pyruvoyl trahydropterin synthase family protein n=1 Tax=Mycobacterium sp. 236(2023) TaxID=3038163 RepID=UPI00241572A4|nr:6-carboxytetrahydropterin synthase [Mycobacterium sp. 236(2023)]MDG4667531.1 6-carboxytetrahydropterin synthase [Mycobacterium sp. 236(2023)]